MATSKPKRNKWIITSIVLSIFVLTASLAAAGYILYINHQTSTIYSEIEKKEESKQEDISKIDKLTDELAEKELSNSELQSEVTSRRGFI